MIGRSFLPSFGKGPQLHRRVPARREIDANLLQIRLRQRLADAAADIRLLPVLAAAAAPFKCSQDMQLPNGGSQYSRATCSTMRANPSATRPRALCERAFAVRSPRRSLEGIIVEDGADLICQINPGTG
jgi:hypothetical protein